MVLASRYSRFCPTACAGTIIIVVVVGARAGADAGADADAVVDVGADAGAGALATSPLVADGMWPTDRIHDAGGPSTGPADARSAAALRRPMAASRPRRMPAVIGDTKRIGSASATALLPLPPPPPLLPLLLSPLLLMLMLPSLLLLLLLLCV